jgi:hypothetical protein
LALMAIVLWGYAIALAVDRLDGRSSEPREDVVAFYVAGKLLNEGHADWLYDVPTVANEEAEVLGRPAGYHGGLPYLNPPFVAGMFYPLSLLPYGAAQAVWLGLSVAALAASLALLWPELRRLDRRWAVVFVLAVIASAPVFWSLLYGQLSTLALLSWVASYRLLKARREGAAGLVLAVCLIKPPLAVVPALYLLMTGRWRALAGFIVGGAPGRRLAGPRGTTDGVGGLPTADVGEHGLAQRVRHRPAPHVRLEWGAVAAARRPRAGVGARSGWSGLAGDIGRRRLHLEASERER